MFKLLNMFYKSQKPQKFKVMRIVRVYLDYYFGGSAKVSDLVCHAGIY